MNKLKLALLGLVLSASAAFGQTAPNWTQGYIPSPAEWNAVFASKQDYLGSAPLLVNGGTMTGELITAPSAASSAGLNVPPGVAPTSPVNGDLWSTSAGFFVQVNGATIGPLTEGTSGSFAATTPIGVSFSGGTVTYSCATCGVTGSPLSQFASTTSAQLAGIISDESGTGPLLFGTSPSITTPTINFGTAAASGIAVVSANTGFFNALQVENGGTVANTGTGVEFSAILTAGTNTGVSLGISGGGSPSAFLASGAGLTGGMTISAGAGPLNITNPILSTPTLGVAKATSLAVGGATIGGNALAVTGTFAFSAGGSFGGALTGITTASMSGALTYGGVTLANSVTGAGSMVLGTAPSISSLTVTTAFTAIGLVTAADLASAAYATSTNVIAGTSTSLLIPPSAIYSAETTTTFGATTTFDFSTFINTAETLTGNVTTQTLSNVKAGQSGQIRFIQDGTGSRTTVWNSIFKFTGGVTPSLSTAAAAIDVLFYSCVSSTLCYAGLNQNMK